MQVSERVPKGGEGESGKLHWAWVRFKPNWSKGGPQGEEWPGSKVARFVVKHWEHDITKAKGESKMTRGLRVELQVQ